MYDRFNRWWGRDFWLKLFDALVDAGAVTKSTAIDSTYIKAQRAAFEEKGSVWNRRSGTRGAAGRPRSTRSPTSSAVPTRYDKLAANFLSGVALATALASWL